MSGDAVSATIGVLVQNLIDISKEEISLIRGLKKNANNLKGTLAMIQNYLDDAQKKFITDEAVRTWLKELEAVAFDADNVLDELDYQLLSNKIMKKSIHTDKKKKVKVACLPISFNKYAHRRQMALTIKEINTSFGSSITRAKHLGLVKRLADAPSAAADIAARETDSFTADPIFVGRDDDVSKIVGMLTNPTERAVSILSIVGMGGLGKTTFVRKVFNCEETKTHFGHHIWIHVSQNFDALLLLKKILRDLGGKSGEHDSKQVVLKNLWEALGGKTYVLVLDDVWNEDRREWEDFINSWSGITTTKGNCILVTTRSTEVGLIVNTLGIHQLKGLSEEECWSIIKEKVFEGGDIPPGIEDIGRSIAERCQGLPLAANVVGGLLRHKSHDEWLTVKDKWLSGDGGEEDNVSSVLRLSYDNLSSPSLKKCFSYCSIFPKGYSIQREELIQLWMAEGFLQSTGSSDMENVGNKFVNLLVRGSLLQVVDRDAYNNVEHCSMHDLVHDVAASVLCPRDNTSDDIYQARYIPWESHGNESSSIQKEQAKFLRTLFYNDEIFDMMSSFKSLHVLFLAGYFEELPDSIRELIHLRFLDISKLIIRNLPDAIGELYHLQTLKANISGLRKLPSTTKYLFNLRHLYVCDDTELPPQLGMLTFLQTLPYFKVDSEDGYRIEELGSMNNLKGTLIIDNLQKVKDIYESEKACIFQKSGIIRLVLRWNVVSGEGERNDRSVLAGLQPHPNLKILEISSFGGAMFPSWTMEMEGLINLMEIRLESCFKCEEIPMMGHLPRLKSIYLSNLQNVKSISSSFYGCSSNNVFPALERLELIHMPNLTEWVEVEIPVGVELKVFPRLEYLKMDGCSQLSSAPSIFPCLKVLNIEEMTSGIPLANICGVMLTSLVELVICRVRRLARLPDWLFNNNQNLSVLRIRSCDDLSKLPNGLHTLNHFEELKIESCYGLTWIPFSGGGQSSLRRLSLPSEISFPRQMVESCSSSLEELQLSWLNADQMQTLVKCMHKMHRLAVLQLTYISKFTLSSPTELGSLRSLKTLVLSPGISWDCVSFNEGVGDILRMGSPSLQRLELTGDLDWESLPDQLQLLTALEVLRLTSFGMKELPEWFGNLSSLKDLHLRGCRRLRFQPFVEAMRRLNLTELKIEDCPFLRERDIREHIDAQCIWVY